MVTLLNLIQKAYSDIVHQIMLDKNVTEYHHGPEIYNLRDNMAVMHMLSIFHREE